MTADLIDTDVLVAKQQRLWLSGSRIPAEELLSEHGVQPETQPAIAVDLIYGEILLREDQGEQPEESEYSARFPELAAEIARQFQIHRLIGAEAPREPGSTVRQAATVSDTEVSPGPEFPEIPGFDLLRVAGRGGSGIAYRAIDRQLKRVVAVKLVLNTDQHDEQRSRMLLREAEAAAALRHPAIVEVFQVGHVNGSPFLVMEYVAGGTLARRLTRGAMNVDEAAHTARQIAEGIQHAHDAGIIHRDLKPGNILLDTHGRPQIADFGLARRLDADESLHATGDVVGTPAYMAPEQARGEKATELSDVYSLGAVLYESLAGRPPFQAATPWDIIHQVVTSDPLPLTRLNPSLPTELETICQKCLEKDPSRRYQSAGEVAQELERVLQGRPIVAQPIGRAARLMKWCRRNPIVACLVGVSVALLLAIGVGSSVAAFTLAARNQTIRDEQVRATKAESRAVSDREAAIASLSDLVDSLHEEITDDSATIRTRERVVSAAIDGLTAITTAEQDDRADEASVRALRKLADLLDLRTSHAEALEVHQRALRIARTLNRDANSLSTRLNLAETLVGLSNHHIRRRQFDAAAAVQAEATEILDDLARSLPPGQERTRVLRAVTGLLTHRLDQMWSVQNHDGIIAVCEDSEADILELLRVSGEDADACETAQAFYFRYGRAYFDKAEAVAAGVRFQTARKWLDKALAAKPRRGRLREASAVLYRAAGLMQTLLGHPDLAKHLFAGALSDFRQLSLADPDNARRERQVANTMVLTAKPLQALGEQEAAIAELNAGITIYRKQLESNNDEGTRLLIADALNSRANSEMYLNRFDDAALTYAEILPLLQPDKSVPVTHPGILFQKQFTETMLDAISLSAGKQVADASSDARCLASLFLCRRAATQSADEPGKDVLLLLRSLALTPDVNSVTDVFDAWSRTSGLSPLVAGVCIQMDARVCSLRAAQAGDGQLRQALIDRGLAKLQQLTAMMPGGNAAEMVLTEPDLTWLRGTPAFSEAGIVSDQASAESLSDSP